MDCTIYKEKEINENICLTARLDHLSRKTMCIYILNLWTASTSVGVQTK